MWTPATRQQHNRTITRYQTDLTDAEWRVIAPLLPMPCATGRPREWPMREIINGIFYVMRAGCPWRLLPNDLPPWGTIYRWFAVWRNNGCFERINHALVMADRERVGRDASPTAAIIDSQSAKTTEAGGPRGCGAGKKVNGRKRHALVDTDGRGFVLEPHPASIQDRDGGGPLLGVSPCIFPFIQRVFLPNEAHSVLRRSRGIAALVRWLPLTTFPAIRLVLFGEGGALSFRGKDYRSTAKSKKGPR
jgi:putative transposase